MSMQMEQTSFFTSRMHYALQISKRHSLSPDTYNCHCQRFTYFFYNYVFTPDFCITLLQMIVIQYIVVKKNILLCVAPVGPMLVYVFPNKQSINQLINQSKSRKGDTHNILISSDFLSVIPLRLSHGVLLMSN